MATLRKRLFGEEKNVDEVITANSSKRPGREAESTVNPLEDARLFANEEERHEGLANELLRLTKSMKENFSIAGNVIKDDNMTLTAMQSVAEANRSNLEREGKRLEHHASKSCFEWTMLLTVVLIIWSFVAMVVIMKVFPKRV